MQTSWYRIGIVNVAACYGAGLYVASALDPRWLAVPIAGFFFVVAGCFIGVMLCDRDAVRRQQ